MKKLFCLLLAALLLASCGTDLAVTTEAPVTTAAPETTAPANDVPDLPDPSTLDLAGEFNFLVSGNIRLNDFAAEDDESTAVKIAIYRRNKIMQEKYGVEITSEDVTKFGDTRGNGPGFTKVYTDYMAGDHLYDAALIGTYDVAVLAYNGFIHDLYDVPHIDLSKAYWDQRANVDLAVNGKMYYTTGEITTSDNVMTHAIMFNKDVRQAYDLEDPYTLVRDDEWTMEKFIQLAKSIGEDLNQDGVYDTNDKYGLMTCNDATLAFLSSAGEKIASVNEEGLIELTFYNERVLELFDRFTELCLDTIHSHNYQRDANGQGTAAGTWDGVRDAIFNEGRALFYTNFLQTVERHRDSEVNFGILPYPKLDETQQDYGHLVSPFQSQFICVPEMAADHARSGFVLETLAYEGLQIMTPAYYEQTLVGKSVRDEDSVDMLDIIFASRVYDLGAYYNVGTLKDQLGTIYSKRLSVATIYETYKDQAQVKIDTINEIMLGLQ